MPMRERRAAHVRPRPPASDRLSARSIKAAAPAPDLMRRYRPVRTGARVPPQMAFVLVGACVVLGFVTLTVGTGLMADFVGQVAGAFSNAITHMASQAPATAPPSGVQLDTPVLDVPSDNGYTNQPSVVIQGSVPGGSVGKTGYTVHLYQLGKSGSQREVAVIPVGTTTYFSAPAVALTEGDNSFMATLATPAGEGQPSPVVKYTLDTKPPKITITSPAAGAKLTTATIDVSGTCDAGATVTIRNEQKPGGAFNSQVVGADGHFKLNVPVVAGSNTIDLTATDQATNSTSTSVTVNRDFGKLAAHLAVSPTRFAASSQTTLKMTVHATSFNGGPLANAKVTFTVTIQGLGPIVSPELTTDATGVVDWQVAISGASAGTGQASALLTSDAGDQVIATAAVTTT
jgi:hypothetical protein